MKIVLVASVGTTPEPIKKAIKEASEEGEVAVFLIYGRPFLGQTPSPLEAVTEIKKFAEEKGLKVRTFEIQNPESLDKAMETFSQALEEAEGISPDKIIADFTGGTKVMSVSLALSSLKKVQSELIFQYIGGERGEEGRVIEKEMRRMTYTTAINEMMDRIIESARQYNFSQALAISENLPPSGRSGFLKRAAKALYLWDQFHYDEAVREIGDLRGEAKILKEEKAFSKIAESLLRLGESGWKVKKASDFMLNWQKGEGKKSPQDFLIFLPADILPNAERRFKEGRFAEVVLRAYRAVETSIQISLILLGQNPWNPSWNIDGLEEYLKAVNKKEPPAKIALYDGFILLEHLTSPFDEDVRKKLWYLTNMRNDSYLEHGYLKIDKSKAEKSLEYANSISETVLSQVGFSPEILLKAKKDLQIEI